MFSGRDIQNIQKVIEICASNEDWLDYVPTLERAKSKMLFEESELQMDEKIEREIDEIIESLEDEVEIDKRRCSRTVRIVPGNNRIDRYGRYHFTIIGIGATGLDFIDHIKDVGCWSDYSKTVAIDCDYHRAIMCQADYKVVPGKEIYGKSLKGDYEKGAILMSQSRTEIENAIREVGNNKHAIVILNCGGACSAGIETVIEVLNKFNISFVVGAFIPFDFESRKRREVAQKNRERMEKYKDIVFIDNSNIKNLLDRRSTIQTFFTLAFKEMIKKVMPDVFYRDYVRKGGLLKDKGGNKL